MHLLPATRRWGRGGDRRPRTRTFDACIEFRIFACLSTRWTPHNSRHNTHTHTTTTFQYTVVPRGSSSALHPSFRHETTELNQFFRRRALFSSAAHYGIRGGWIEGVDLCAQSTAPLLRWLCGRGSRLAGTGKRFERGRGGGVQRNREEELSAFASRVRRVDGCGACGAQNLHT